MKNNSDSMLNQDSTDALDILIQCLAEANPDDKTYNSFNSSIIEKYREILERSDLYDQVTKDQIMQTLSSSRALNQLNAEDLAKYADNLNVARDYLLDDREMEK